MYFCWLNNRKNMKYRWHVGQHVFSTSKLPIINDNYPTFWSPSLLWSPIPRFSPFSLFGGGSVESDSPLIYCRAFGPIYSSSHLCHPFPFSLSIILYDALRANLSSFNDPLASHTALIGFQHLILILFFSITSCFRPAFGALRMMFMYSKERLSEPRRQYIAPSPLFDLFSVL